MKQTTDADSSDPILEAFRARLLDLKALEPWHEKRDQAFFVADSGRVQRQLARWKEELPDVSPYYAVKSNPDARLLSMLAALGTGFDCASIEEMRSVLDLRVSPTRIIFANPVKSPSSLAFASRHGIRKMTVDSVEEVDKIARLAPDAKLSVRIYAEDASAKVKLGKKFGISLAGTEAVLVRAHALGLAVSGVSFHVGTGASDPKAYAKALHDAATFIAQAERRGIRIEELDIGGGFQDHNLSSLAQAIRQTAIESISPTIRLTAEPGRFLCRSAFHAFTKVIATKTQGGPAEQRMLYQSDGVFGNFLNAWVEHEVFRPRLIKNGRFLPSTQAHLYRVWGPTCDSTDCVAEEAMLDAEAEVDDWLWYREMGAYTLANSTEFNGFRKDFDIIWI